jgi:predicted oxidoreductase (fatty acid repression mutant protein)
VTELVASGPAALFLGDADPALTLQSLLARRRSIRRLGPGPFPLAARERLLEAVRHTPASYNLPPWRVVLVHERRAALWEEVAVGFRESLEGERRERYLERLAGFAGGVGATLVFVDLDVERALREEKELPAEVAASYVQQALGMVQLALWLAVVAEGVATSLQHWDAFVGPRLARFAALDEERHRLVATMPIGYPAEAPAEIVRAASGLAEDRRTP